MGLEREGDRDSDMNQPKRKIYTDQLQQITPHQIDDDEYERWMEMNDEREATKKKNVRWDEEEEEEQNTFNKSLNPIISIVDIIILLFCVLSPVGGGAAFLFDTRAPEHQTQFGVRNAWQPTSINLPCELHYLFVRASLSSFSFANKYDKMLSRFTISRISSAFVCPIMQHTQSYVSMFQTQIYT